MSKDKEVKFVCEPLKCTYDSEDYRVYAVDVDLKRYKNIQTGKYGNVTIFGNLHELCFAQPYEITAVEQLTKYGYGYKVTNIRMEKPKSENDIYIFLQEILTFNQASELWKNYPDIVDRVVSGNIEDIDLNKLKGIKEYTFEKIKDKILQNYALYDLVVEFGGILSMSILKKIYDQYPDIVKLKDMLKKEPYKCLTKISGIGFIKADQMLLSLEREKKLEFNFDLKSSKQRCMACVEYFLEENQNNGHTKMDLRDLRKQVMKLVPSCSDHYVECLKDEDIYYNKETFDVALRITYNTEKYISDRLKMYNCNPNVWDIDWTIYKDGDEYSLTDEQASALKCLCQNNIMVLNGYSGAGKSSTCGRIIKMLEDNNKTYKLFAPTGRAAKVLGDYTGKPASTIHRGLGYMPPNHWEYDEEYPLECDVLLIDEFSMTDIFLFYRVLKALNPNKTKLMMIGDSAQLPSVGPGNLLFDIIQSGKIPTVSLNKIFRYGEGGLMTVATDIRNAKTYLGDISSKCTPFGNKDYVYIFENDNTKIVSEVVALYKKLLENNKPEDIMVLSAYNKGNCGTIVINNQLQKVANPNYGTGRYIQIGDTEFFEDDIVLQTVNNYKAKIDLGFDFSNSDDEGDTTFIPNGMTGKIIYADSKYVIINFDGIEVRYDKADMLNVSLGYSISCHRSQGGSAKIVIVLTPSCHEYMMNSNLLYVALTRTKQQCYHIGNKDTINRSVKKKENYNRKTFLLDELKSNTMEGNDAA